MSSVVFFCQYYRPLENNKNRKNTFIFRSAPKSFSWKIMGCQNEINHLGFYIFSTYFYLSDFRTEKIKWKNKIIFFSCRNMKTLYF